jgi:peptide/nickel transport system substrate-binding protein
MDGERVPPYTINYISDAGDSPTMENMLPLIQNDLQKLGLRVELQPGEQASVVGNTAVNEQSIDCVFWPVYSVPSRLDPTGNYEENLITGIGESGFSGTQWASCEGTDLQYRGSLATSLEEQKGIYEELARLYHQDAVKIPVADRKSMGAYSADITPSRVGKHGPVLFNPYFFLYSEPPDGDELLVGVTAPQTTDTANFTLLQDSEIEVIWNRLIHSVLVGWNEEQELVNVLAETYEMSDNADRFYFELKDATFHNGDPITAEDVAFTYEFLVETADLSSDRTNSPISSTNVIDEKTVEIETEDPELIFQNETLHRWGVLHRETWADAVESPQTFTYDPVEMPGSGPYEVTSRQTGVGMTLTPHDGHPVHQPDHDITFQLYNDDVSLLTALEQGEVDMAPSTSWEAYRQGRDTSGVEAAAEDGFTGFYLLPQQSHGPSQFLEFRRALGTVINRRRINEAVFDGEAREPLHGSYFLKNHPTVPDDLGQYTDNPEGDVDAARALLSDAGWQWDNNDNLYYPPDADVSPRWEQGEGPDPSNHDCLSEDGSYIPPSER